jgi:hypothetical protein
LIGDGQFTDAQGLYCFVICLRLFLHLYGFVIRITDCGDEIKTRDAILAN